ncbi:MAG: putative basic amino acid antiporter YfcC [Pseudomonadales bacterium]|nr:putative basic amino acid antiporter YfcC [Pseudomonadales bacterium]
MPDTYLLIGAVGLFAYALSFVLNPGFFAVQEVLRNGVPVVAIDPDSFRFVEGGAGLPLFSSDGSPALFNAIFEGLVSGGRNGGAVGIMAFILLTGGAFGVVLATGSVNRGLGNLIARHATDGRVLLASLFIAFSLGGAIFGMSEETIPFVLMLVPVLQRLGYDNVTTLLVTFIATQIGFATSWMNPFNVAVAQGIAQLPLLSGLPLRLAMWVVFTAFGILFTLRYAVRTRNLDNAAEPPHAGAADRLQLADRLLLCALAATILWIVWGVVFGGYYLPEIATQFVILGIVSGFIGCIFRLDGMHANKAVEAFRQGAMGLLPAALVVGLARGIVFLLGGDDPTQPSLVNTLLHYGSQSLEGLPGWLAAWGMLCFQSVFNFFVPSGSGQAALTMPLMAPLSDLIGVTRQVAVLAFQLGDGLTNMLVPTSASLMGCLGAARLDWLQWVRVARGFFLALFVLASAFVLAASLSGYH